MKTVMIRRLGSESVEHPVVVIEVELDSGKWVELGREPLDSNFSSAWDVSDEERIEAQAND